MGRILKSPGEVEGGGFHLDVGEDLSLPGGSLGEEVGVECRKVRVVGRV